MSSLDIMRVSIVINTFNRCRLLRQTLESLRQLRYSKFEVIVVNGPSDDGTNELLEKWKSSIKVASCSEPNLSVSRNIGLAAASGDIVAFLDDDAIPEPQWLDKIVAGYDSDEIGGVGGPVYNQYGYELQTRYIVCDRFGNAILDVGFNPTSFFNIPGGPRYVSLLGTNSSFRRSALIKIGGFDEEFAYYLDETDVCLRMVDNGWVVKYVDSAFVYHKFAASDVRATVENRGILVKRYQPLKSKAYFCFKHGGQSFGYAKAMQQVLDYAQWHRGDAKWNIDWCVQHGYQPLETLEDLEPVINRALTDGVNCALSTTPVYLSLKTIKQFKSPFKQFDSRRVAKNRLNICLLTQQYPPRPIDGIGRAVYELSAELASLGHTVHILTLADTHNSVDLENGVWVHRLVIREHENPIENFPQRIWNYSQTMMGEVNRIHEFDKVDIVQAPAWDCEGIAPLLDGKIPVITSLHTPMLIAASMHAAWLTDGVKMQKEIVPLLRWEREIMLFSDGLAANTNAIVSTIQQEYGLALDHNRIAVVGHGLHDRMTTDFAVDTVVARKKALGSADLRLLFIGRLEFRKGIDVLLASLQDLLPRYPNLHADIVGEDGIEAGKSFKMQFLETAAGTEWATRVTFHGRVDDELLYDYIKTCDVFVAPSRFESFGLIFLQAMMYGKPCVGTNIGGIGEVVLDGETGLLVAPSNSSELIRAIERLIESRDLRSKFGKAGRQRYLTRFNTRAWVENSLEHYRSVLRASRLRRERDDSGQPINLSRHCTLSDFRPMGPLYQSLTKTGGSIVHWRNWAIGITIKSLLQKTVYNGSTPQKSLVVSDFTLPNIAAHVPGWNVETIQIASTDVGSLLHCAHGASGIIDASAKFDFVSCVAVLDPLCDGFTNIVSELARACLPGGFVQILIGLKKQTKCQAKQIADQIGRRGLQANTDLAAFFRAAAPPLNTDEYIEPCLGVRIASEDCPIVALELRRARSAIGIKVADIATVKSR
jgi:glycogen synthase